MLPDMFHTLLWLKSRILDYDGTYVTFWYQRHEDNKIVIEKIHDFEFISRIILHIPEKIKNILDIMVVIMNLPKL